MKKKQRVRKISNEKDVYKTKLEEKKEDVTEVDRGLAETGQQPASDSEPTLKEEKTEVKSASDKEPIKDWKKKYGKPILSVNLSDSTQTVLLENGIFYEKETEKGVATRVVYQGSFKPIRKLTVDENVVYEVLLDTPVIGDLNYILNTMKARGGVVSKNNLNDCVNALIKSSEIPVEIGHAACGVYEEQKKLKLCLKPFPLSDEQERIIRQVEQATTETLTKEKLQAYIDVLKHWNPYEILICLALGIIATFGYTLKHKKILIAYPFHSSPEHGLGKSLVALIFSQYLYGITSESMSAICSDFRLTDALDSFCGLKCIDEAEKFPWNGRLGEQIKQSAESPLQGKRGSPDKTSRIYHARLVPCFTGNGFPITGKSNLVRFLRDEFDLAKKQDRNKRENSVRLWNIIYKLQPIGFRLVELELEDLHYDLDELVNRIQRYASEIAKEYGEFIDGRRAPAWGVVYEGLKSWERACKKYQINWKAPSIKEFVKHTVKEIESVTFETKLIPLDDFVEWFISYKAKEKNTDGVGKTENVLWKYYDLVIKPGDEPIKGTAITNRILKQYNRENSDVGISNLGDLARCVSQQCGLRVEDIYEPKRFRIGEKSWKGVFLPESLFIQDENPSNPGTQTTLTEQINDSYETNLNEEKSNPDQQEESEGGYQVTTDSNIDEIVLLKNQEIISHAEEIVRHRKLPAFQIARQMNKSNMEEIDFIQKLLKQAAIAGANGSFKTSIRADNEGFYFTEEKKKSKKKKIGKGKKMNEKNIGNGLEHLVRTQVITTKQTENPDLKILKGGSNENRD